MHKGIPQQTAHPLRNQQSPANRRVAPQHPSSSAALRKAAQHTEKVLAQYPSQNSYTHQECVGVLMTVALCIMTQRQSLLIFEMHLCRSSNRTNSPRLAAGCARMHWLPQAWSWSVVVHHADRSYRWAFCNRPASRPCILEGCPFFEQMPFG